MFQAFAEYTGDTDIFNMDTEEKFRSGMSGKALLNGMYRFFKIEDIDKWNKIVEAGFPAYKGRIDVFGYDWLGRVFAMNKATNTVLLFEPGTGEVLDIPANFKDFHNVEIAEYHEDSLASAFFEEWFEEDDNYILDNRQCAGYKVPLFLNGEDDVENLEVSDMEVYWGIMTQLMP